MTIKLRPYQEEIEKEIINSWDRGNKNVLMVLPTGSGKTVVMSDVVNKESGAVCLICHRQELVSQISMALAKNGIVHRIIGPKKVIDMIIQMHLDEFGQMFYNNQSHIGVAGVRTLVRRGNELKNWLPTVKLWVIDECHHLQKKNEWGKAVEMFSNARGLGVSVFGETKILIRHNNIIKMMSIENLYPDVLDANDISQDELYTRAWSNSRCDFVWAKITHFHRYKCVKQCSIVTTKGNKSIKVTNDHSLMKVSGSSSLIETPSNELNIGDELLLDNSKYDFMDNNIDVIDICKNVNKVRVYGDFNTDDIMNSLTHILHNKTKVRSLKYAWKKSKSIPLNYFNIKDITRVQGLSTEGSTAKSPIYIPIKLISWLLGYYTGNGWLDGRICLSVPFKKVEYVINEIEKLFKSFGKFKISVRQRQGSSEIKFNHYFLTKIFENIVGKGALNKKIPNIIFSASEPTKKSFIEGLIDSDGHINEGKQNRLRVHYVTISNELSQGLQLLLNSMGTYSTISIRKKSKGGIIDGRQIQGSYDSFDINFSLNSFYGNNSGHKGDRKHSKWLLKGKPLTIIKIEPIDSPEYVYDLTIDVDSHTFVGNGLLAHNTATPLRADGRGLGADNDGEFHEMVVGPSMRDLINQGYLTEYRIFAPTSNVDMSDARRSKATGDWNKNDVSKAVSKSNLVIHDKATQVGDVVKHYLRIAPGKLGITFVPDMATGREIEAQFNAMGVRAKLVNANTPDDERAKISKQFEKHEYEQLINVDIFGEGYDVPSLEVVSFARPTASYGLYIQQFGRALRILEGKTHGIIIDHVSNVANHGLPDAPREWSLERRKKRGEQDDDVMPVKICPECTFVFEKYKKACPNCGHIPVPSDRSSIEYVDGDLSELSPEVLAAMRSEIDVVDSSIDDQVIEYRRQLQIKDTKPEYVRAHCNRLTAKLQHQQDSQKILRDKMAWWAGHRRSEGRTDDELFKIFYFKYGVDWITAQTLMGDEADALIEGITLGKKF